MDDKLSARRLAIVPTTNCSLNCRLCCDFLNGPVKRRNIPFESVCRDIDACFKLIDHVEWLQFVGGEIFLYRDFFKLLHYVRKYQSQFERIIIESNATLFPNKETWDAIISYGRDISIFYSDYGELSKAKDKAVAFMDAHNIDYRFKKYYGEDQYFDGWIDNRNPHYLNEPGDVLEVNAKNCPQCVCENMHCFDGRLHRCASSCFMHEMDLFEPLPGDYVDLRDSSVSQEGKREIIRQFYIRARKSCQYCKFKYIGILPRHPAAEQL